MFLRNLILLSFIVFKASQSEIEIEILNDIFRATCDADMHVIPLQHPKIMNNNKFLRLYPSCVRTPQCNGCCKNREKCTPKNIVKQFYQTYLIDSSIQPIAQVVKAFAYKHENCQCQCELTAKDCTEHQKFNEKECNCICPPNKKEKCQNDSKIYRDTFIWNEDTCSCDCINEDCTLGFHRNDYCECVEDYV